MLLFHPEKCGMFTFCPEKGGMPASRPEKGGMHAFRPEKGGMLAFRPEKDGMLPFRSEKNGMFAFYFRTLYPLIACVVCVFALQGTSCQPSGANSPCAKCKSLGRRLRHPYMQLAGAKTAPGPVPSCYRLQYDAPCVAVVGSDTNRNVAPQRRGGFMVASAIQRFEAFSVISAIS